MPHAFSISVPATILALVGLQTSTGVQTPRIPITRCNGRFVSMPSPNPGGSAVTRLFDVEVIAPNDIWAVGMHRDVSASSTDQYSLTMHFDGVSWSIVPSPSPVSSLGSITVALNDVSALSTDLVYAAGSYVGGPTQSPDTFVIRWNGSQWDQIQSPGQSQFGAQGFLFEAVEAIDPTNVWFGGQWAATPPRASMVRYDGSGFTTFLLPLVPGSNGAYRIRAISALSTDEIWAVGATGGTAPAIGKSYIARWDGSTWQHVPTPHLGFGENLYDVVALSSDNVWASGTYDDIVNGVPTPTPLFLHWDGSSWNSYFGQGFALDLAARGPNDIFGVDGQQLVHWDGSFWSVIDQIAPASPPTLWGVDVVGRCELVVVGFNSFSPLSSTSLIAMYR